VCAERGDDGSCLSYRNVLNKSPAIECDEGLHLKLKILVLLLVPVYFVILIPFATVGGDPFYVPRTTLYDYNIWEDENMWKRAARRKASDMYMGFLHRSPDQAFVSQFAELVAKCILPFATTELTFRPVLQMVLVTIVGTAMWVQSVKYPPFLEAKFLTLVQDLKFMTMAAMQIGLVVVCLDYVGGVRQALLPVVLLAVIIFGTLCHLVYNLWTIPLKRHSVLRFYAGKAPPDEDSLLPEDAA